MLFSDVLKSLLVNSSLPFNLDFSITPRSSNPIIHKTSWGLEIPLYNNLLVREKTFLESYLLDANKQRNKIEQSIEILAYELNIDLGLKSMTLSRALVNGDTSTGDSDFKDLVVTNLNSDTFQSWKAQRIAKFSELLEQISAISSESTRDFFLITIFLASRTFGDWTVEDTMNLTTEEAKEVLDIFYSETGNKEEAEITEAAPEVVEDLGKD
jgi:hypothetical protein